MLWTVVLSFALLAMIISLIDFSRSPGNGGAKLNAPSRLLNAGPENEKKNNDTPSVSAGLPGDDIHRVLDNYLF